MSRSASTCIVSSLILHFAVLLLVDYLFIAEREVSFIAEREVSVFRARLVTTPRFVQEQNLRTRAPTLLSVDMEYLRSESGPASLPEGVMPLAAAAETVSSPQFEDYDPTLPKGDGVEFLVEAMPDPTAPSVVDSTALEAMELLRIEDLMRADAERALIIPDLYHRRGTRGFVKFTSLRLNGAWSYGLDESQGGRPVLEDLARYVRDGTERRRTGLFGGVFARWGDALY